MAALIFAALGLGVASAFITIGRPLRQNVLQLHKSIGLTLLASAVLRLGWRLRTGEPSYPRPLRQTVHAVSHAGHPALYALMIVMPATSYLFSAMGGCSLP